MPGKVYSLEVRHTAVAAVLEHGASVARIAGDLGASTGSIYNWVTAARNLSGEPKVRRESKGAERAPTLMSHRRRTITFHVVATVQSLARIDLAHQPAMVVDGAKLPDDLRSLSQTFGIVGESCEHILKGLSVKETITLRSVSRKFAFLPLD